MFFWVDHNKELFQITNISPLAGGSLSVEHLGRGFSKSIERFDDTDRYFFIKGDTTAKYGCSSGTCKFKKIKNSDFVKAINDKAKELGIDNISSIMEKAKLNEHGIIDVIFSSIGINIQ